MLSPTPAPSDVGGGVSPELELRAAGGSARPDWLDPPRPDRGGSGPGMDAQERPSSRQEAPCPWTSARRCPDGRSPREGGGHAPSAARH